MYFVKIIKIKIREGVVPGEGRRKGVKGILRILVWVMFSVCSMITERPRYNSKS